MPASRRKVIILFVQNEQAYGFDNNGRFFNAFLFFSKRKQRSSFTFFKRQLISDYLKEIKYIIIKISLLLSKEKKDDGLFSVSRTDSKLFALWPCHRKSGNGQTSHRIVVCENRPNWRGKFKQRIVKK
jgi:hypothetical protein